MFIEPLLSWLSINNCQVIKKDFQKSFMKWFLITEKLPILAPPVTWFWRVQCMYIIDCLNITKTLHWFTTFKTSCCKIVRLIFQFRWTLIYFYYYYYTQCRSHWYNFSRGYLKTKYIHGVVMLWPRSRLQSQLTRTFEVHRKILS